MFLKTKLYGHTYEFSSIKEVLGKANEMRSGDRLIGIAAETSMERVAAKVVLANMTVADLRNNPVVPYESDEVTRINQDMVDESIYNEFKNKTISELREWILSDGTSSEEVGRLGRGLTAEVIAGVAKLMSNLDLICGAAKIHVQAHCNTTIGMPGTLGVRLQPNHPTDDLDGVTASIYEGLSYGCGDAVIGINPVDDTVDNIIAILDRFHEIKTKFSIPTQTCALAHVTTQMEAVRRGAKVDLFFQSIAGSEKGNRAFGISKDMMDEALELIRSKGTGAGPNYMYLETGQGSECSADANFGADQVTLEARCYAFGRRYSPFLVNTVVGFIGPEYLYNSKQVIRAGLEDHFMGKLSGVPMGCDACYTNHMEADQNDIENLAVLLSAAGCNYFMGIPHGDDVMLNYQTTGFHDMASVRSVLHLRPVHEFEQWLEKMGIWKDGKLTAAAGDASIFM